MNEILIIDDEPDVRESVGQVLQDAGYEVRMAVDGLAGIEACRVRRPDLVITDLIMPKGHGFDAITLIRREHPGLRIIAISGGGNFWPAEYQGEAISTNAYLAAALKFGADAILTKPFDRKTLLAEVRKWLPAASTPAPG
jgi:DNA-binding response OmpR family regulator